MTGHTWQVRRRAIALVMTELLRLLDITGLRPQVLIGKDIDTDFSFQVCLLLVTPSYLSVEAELGTSERYFLRV
jgi:hypothetical protein